MEEKRVVNSSYIITFLNDIENLLDYAGAYINIMVQLSSKYEGAETIDLTPSENEQLQNVTNILRSLVYKTYVRVSALEPNFKEKNIKEKIKKLKSKYEDIKGRVIPEINVIEEYTKLINEIYMQSLAFNEFTNNSSKELEGLAK